MLAAGGDRDGLFSGQSPLNAALFERYVQRLREMICTKGVKAYGLDALLCIGSSRNGRLALAEFGVDGIVAALRSRTLEVQVWCLR